MPTSARAATADDRARSGAQTVERAIAILNLFREDHDALPITVIARSTGLNVSTAHRLVRTLVNEDFMEQDPRTEQYRLGAAMAVLGQRAVESSGFTSAQPVVDELSERTGESVSLAVRRGNEVMIVVHSACRHALRFEHPSGSALYLHASAMGKALLAFGPHDHRQAITALGRLPRFTPATLTTHSALADELAVVRERGFALNEEERYVGASGVAAPILDSRGMARGAMGVQGPSVRLDGARLRELAALVVQAAADVARPLLGHP